MFPRDASGRATVYMVLVTTRLSVHYFKRKEGSIWISRDYWRSRTCFLLRHSFVHMTWHFRDSSAVSCSPLRHCSEVRRPGWMVSKWVGQVNFGHTISLGSPYRNWSWTTTSPYLALVSRLVGKGSDTTYFLTSYLSNFPFFTALKSQATT